MNNNSEQPIQSRISDPTSFQRMFMEPIPPSPQQSHLVSQPHQPPLIHAPVRSRARRAPRNDGRSLAVPIPFIWATDRRVTVHNFNYLSQNGIFNITGDVQCKRCQKMFQMSFDLREKFPQIWKFIAGNKNSMRDRAPTNWMHPRLPKCLHCNQENSVKPIIAKKKRSINWLFLLLGQMLGCCTLKQLRYSCKHTNNHRTGAKDRVLYLTYLALCKQLDPNGPFDV